jgi:uncharacterized glyoxalase superfamily metalloenzyme YdcJ
MAMFPVGYYDLSVAGLPIHSTAFRPVTKEELAKNPFRIFTSLLRADLLDPGIRSEAEAVLAKRDIFTPRLRELLQAWKSAGGFTAPETEEFIREALETFRWHSSARVSRDLYNKLLKINGLLADIVCFRGPHINHLTPRVLDIYRVHRMLQAMEIETIPEVQGPPDECPILLKQTSFRALNEAIQFPEEDGSLTGGNHRARFGEIESRGCAITPEARDIYDRLILEVNQKAKLLREDNSPEEYRKAYPAILNQVFRRGFPAWSFEDLRRQKLGYFHYQWKETTSDTRADTGTQALELDSALSPEEQMDALIRDGRVTATPITYEDFLPVSAAGIFKSNLDEQSGAIDQADPNQILFEESLGKPVLDPFQLYREEQEESIRDVLKKLNTQNLSSTRA